MHSTTELKINIGCGPHGKSGWINLDWGILAFLNKIPSMRSFISKVGLLPEAYNKPWPSNPKLHNCSKPLPFSDNCVDFIYTSHFIEHLPRYKTAKLFFECKRILKPEGVLRISIPDLRLLSEKYISNDREFFLKFQNSEDDRGLQNAGDLFVYHFYSLNTWSEPTLKKRILNFFTRGHVWMYDFESLEALLRVAGFTNVKRCAPGQGSVPDIDFLDIHRNSSLFVEAK